MPNRRKVEKSLRQRGYELIPGRGKGGHRFFRRRGTGAVIIVPAHRGGEIGEGITRSIAKHIGIPYEDIIRGK